MTGYIYTIGFELESFCEERIEAYADSVSHWSVGYWQDGSGPYETTSPPFKVFSRHLPEPLLLALKIFNFRDDDCFIECYYDEYDDEEECATAGLHHHVAINGSTSRLYEKYEPLYEYLVAHLPLLQFLTSPRYSIKAGNITYDYRDVNERKRWARVPPRRISESEFHRRYYYAVTPNPSECRKPFTLEIRLCESSPLKCVPMLATLLTGYENGVYIDAYQYYYKPVPVSLVIEYLSRTLPYMPDSWEKMIIKRIYRGLLTGEIFDPMNLSDVADLLQPFQ